jgi:NADH-quinone oxidoreductase subunit J
MTLFYNAIFYTLSAMILLSTFLAITRSNTVHAVVYLVFSFLGTALLFYLLGAPLLAALEVIIYAGAIMVLFLFIIMTMRTEEPLTHGGEEPPVSDETQTTAPAAPTHHSSLTTHHYSFPWRQWLFPGFLGAVCLVAAGLLIFGSPEAGFQLMPAMASPVEFGAFLFEKYWFPVEIVSFLLFVALVGALYLGKRESKAAVIRGEGKS